MSRAYNFVSLLLFACLALATEPVVKVLNGSYSGQHLPQFAQDLFLGMPYAQDTGGQNRFRIPQALNETWEGSRPAKQYSDACPDHEPDDDALYGMSENCLSLNVVRPAGTALNDRLPIMLWIGLPTYNLTYIVQRSVEVGRPIIGASINYRKGGWGNMYSIEIQVGGSISE
ncbi:hypothetical protein LTR37_000665 [Vermiconidia calcicola]|uniref:Uncharacterized protein n=1 Tax=Vermiconidia calcicola TaxID=1690605 RepID=A0ACC3NZP6_9PEZI|nr:hypothetical protein LTR37_000665 [Vermiconidia calcicola]